MPVRRRAPGELIDCHPAYERPAGARRRGYGRRQPETASDLLLERLIDWGVDTIFGLPGDGINGFWEALRTWRACRCSRSPA